MWLETNNAEVIIRLLVHAKSRGKGHVVFGMQPMNMCLQPHQISVFETKYEALVELDIREGHGYLP